MRTCVRIVTGAAGTCAASRRRGGGAAGSRAILLLVALAALALPACRTSENPESLETSVPYEVELAEGLEPMSFTLGLWSSRETSYAPDGSVTEIEKGGRVALRAAAGGRFVVMEGHFPKRPDVDGLLWIFQPARASEGILARGLVSDAEGILSLSGGPEEDGTLRFEGRLGPTSEGPPVRVLLAPRGSGVRVRLQMRRGEEWFTLREEEWTRIE